MPSYFYKAKQDTAHTVTGQINANNEEEALELIHQLGLIPVSIEESTARGVLFSDIRAIRVQSRDLYFFSRQLASLIKSGVPLLKALGVIAQQTKNIYFSKVIGDLARGVKSGRSLCACLADYPAVFHPLFVAMVRAGEEMGQLYQMLHNVSDFFKAQEEFSAKARGAIVYPAFMLIVGAFTVIFILTFVMPKMTVIFADAGQKLPLLTVGVMAISHFFRIFGLPLAVAAAAGFLVFDRWRKTPQGAAMAGKFLLSLPFLREVVLKADLARFTRTMHLLLEGGLPIIRAIEMAAPTIHNPRLRKDLLACAQGLTAGENLGRCLRKSDLIPPMMVQLVAIGEESGSLNESLSDLAETYEADINEATRLVTTILEPLMILAVGLVVGVIVFAMLLPIFSMDLLAH